MGGLDASAGGSRSMQVGRSALAWRTDGRGRDAVGRPVGGRRRCASEQGQRVPVSRLLLLRIASSACVRRGPPVLLSVPWLPCVLTPPSFPEHLPLLSASPRPAAAPRRPGRVVGGARQQGAAAREARAAHGQEAAAEARRAAVQGDAGVGRGRGVRPFRLRDGRAVACCTRGCQGGSGDWAGLGAEAGPRRVRSSRNVGRTRVQTAAQTTVKERAV